MRSCKPRRGAFNKGGSETDDWQILRLDLGSKSHGDSLCSRACLEPALTLWFCWSHLCQIWAWKPWAFRIPDHRPSCPFLVHLELEYCPLKVAKADKHDSSKALWKRSIYMHLRQLPYLHQLLRMKFFCGCTWDWNIMKGRRGFSYVHFLQLHYWRSTLTMMTLDLVVWNTTEASEVFIVRGIGKRDSLWPEQRNNGIGAQSCISQRSIGRFLHNCPPHVVKQCPMSWVLWGLKSSTVCRQHRAVYLVHTGASPNPPFEWRYQQKSRISDALETSSCFGPTFDKSIHLSRFHPTSGLIPLISLVHPEGTAETVANHALRRPLPTSKVKVVFIKFWCQNGKNM